MQKDIIQHRLVFTLSDGLFANTPTRETIELGLALWAVRKTRIYQDLTPNLAVEDLVEYYEPSRRKPVLAVYHELNEITDRLILLEVVDCTYTIAADFSVIILLHLRRPLHETQAGSHRTLPFVRTVANRPF